MSKYILVESFDNPVLIELAKEANKDGYIVFRKSNLNEIPIKLKKYLYNNGLFEKRDSAYSVLDNLFSLHRLVMCCYKNIIGLKVHHILKQVRLNAITQTVPVAHKRHVEIDKMPIKEGIEESEKLQAELQQKIFRPSKNTLANDSDIILEILRMKGQKDEN